MERTIIITTILLGIFIFSGCGVFERTYEGANYESLTNERGDIECYSGGKKVKHYKNIKVQYSSTDSQAIWFITSEGKEKYWQGDAEINIH